MKRHLIISAALAVAALPLSAVGMSASAQQWGSSWTADDIRDARRDGEILPLRTIIRDLENRYGGYLSNAELFSTRDGGREYRIAWITGDGRKIDVVVDAETGNIKNER